MMAGYDSQEKHLGSGTLQSLHILDLSPLDRTIMFAHHLYLLPKLRPGDYQRQQWYQEHNGDQFRTNPFSSTRTWIQRAKGTGLNYTKRM